MISVPSVIEKFDLNVAIVVVIADILDLQIKLWPAWLFAGNDYRALVDDRPRVILVGLIDVEEGAEKRESHNQ